MKQWKDLTDLAGNILEWVDITKKDLEIKIGEIFDTPYTQQVLDIQTVKDILEYKDNKTENEDYFDAYMKDNNTLYVKFIRTAF